jgi:hypothetical protein
MKKLCLVLYAMVACALFIGAGTGPSVTVYLGKLSISAEEVPLDEILTAIGEQTDVSFLVIVGMAVEEVRISEEFSNLDLEEGITRLLKGLNYSFLRDKESGTLKQVLIAGISTKHDSSADSQSSAESLSDEEPSEAAGYEEAGDQVTQAVNEALTAKEPDEQVELLLKLSEMEHAKTVDVLTPILQSEHAEVREATLEAMRWGRVEDAPTLAEVRRLASEDSDPNVRRAALEVIVRYDTTQEGRALLEKVAEGKVEDSRFQEFAKQHLRRMDEEAAAVAAGDSQVDQQGK